MSTSLEDLNQQEALQYTGGVVLVSICMVVGIVGNLHVLHVFWFRTKHSNRRTFALAMAVLDLITCLVVMPFTIVHLRNPITFTLTLVCKGFRYLTYALCLASALIILVIAIDRYKKICFPLGNQFSQRFARNLSICVIVVAACLTWPPAFFYGHSSLKTQDPNITGVRCYISDEYKGSMYHVYFNAFLILLTFGMVCALIALYCRIAKAIMKHDKFVSSMGSPNLGKDPIYSIPSAVNKMSECTDIPKQKDKALPNIPAVMASSDEEDIVSVDNDIIDTNNTNVKTEIFSVLDYRHNLNSVSTSAANGNVISEYNETKTESIKRSTAFAKTKRTTYMFCAITAVFCITYVFQVIVVTTSFAIKDSVSHMSFIESLLYNTACWVTYVSNATNCFIYGFWDQKFRTEVKMVYSRILCRN